MTVYLFLVVDQKADIVFIVGAKDKTGVEIQKAGITTWLRIYNLDELQVHFVFNNGTQSVLKQLDGANKLYKMLDTMVVSNL